MGQLRFSAVPSLTCSRGGLCIFPVAFPTSSQHQQRVLGQSRGSPGTIPGQSWGGVAVIPSRLAPVSGNRNSETRGYNSLCSVVTTLSIFKPFLGKFCQVKNPIYVRGTVCVRGGVCLSL